MLVFVVSRRRRRRHRRRCSCRGLCCSCCCCCCGRALLLMLMIVGGPSAVCAPHVHSVCGRLCACTYHSRIVTLLCAHTHTSRHTHDQTRTHTVSRAQWRVQLQRVCILAFHCRRVPASNIEQLQLQLQQWPEPSKSIEDFARVSLSSNRRVWLNNSNINKNK